MILIVILHTERITIIPGAYTRRGFGGLNLPSLERKQEEREMERKRQERKGKKEKERERE